MERPSREFDAGDARWRAVTAWRGRSGHGLLYFLPLEDGEVAGDDRRDRRALLEPGRELPGLGPEELEEMLDRATALTGTERRFRAPDGRLWLVQSVGPVWAEDGVAEDLTGLVFTSLEGEPERLASGGGHAGRAAASELAARWRRAASDEAGTAAGDASE